MKISCKTKFTALQLIVLMLFVFIPLPKAHAAISPSLGTASTYSILSGSSVTNTGATTISGDVGISPGAGGSPNYTGFGTVTLGGTIHDADGTALTAQADKNTAYAALASQGCTTDYGAVTKELAGENLVPGVYCANSFHLSSGTLTLDGSASDVWIFKSASDLIITGGSANVIFTGGGLPCNVWWRVVSTATFAAGSSLVGNILADTSITFAAGASLNGRALARTAEVTLSSNSITGPTCAAAAATPTPTSTAAASSSSIASSTSSSSSSSTSSTGGAGVCPTLKINTPIIIESRRIDSDSIFISWGPYSGIDTFIVQYGVENGKWVYSTNVKGFSATINDLPPNQPIWVRIAARNDCSVGSYGESKFVGGPRLPNTGFAPQTTYFERSLAYGFAWFWDILHYSLNFAK